MVLGLITALIVLQICTVALVYHKLSKAIQNLRHEVTHSGNNVIQQIEGLMAVHTELRPIRALPKSRGWPASPDFLAVLIRLIHEHEPKVVIECGSGFSTVVLAACLRNLGRGKVLCLENDSQFAEKTRRLLVMHGLAGWAEVVDAPLVPLEVNGWVGKWYDVKNLPNGLKVDMLVVDGPPESTSKLARYPAMKMLHQYMNSGCLIVVDDTLRIDEKAMIERWRHERFGLQHVHVDDCEKGCAVLMLDAST